MSFTFSQGQRLPLSQFTSAKKIMFTAELSLQGELDISLFGLDESKQLADDRYFIFYNQPNSPEQSMQMQPNQTSFLVDLDLVPLHVHRLLLCATTESTPFRQLSLGTVVIQAEYSEVLRYEFTGREFENECAVMLLEVYRYQEAWRVSAVGQGFNGGLEALLKSFGGEVEEPKDLAQNLQLIFGKPSLVISAWLPLKSTEHHSNYQGLQNFRTRFLAACADGIIEHDEWLDLQQTIDRERINAHKALEFVRGDAINLIERTITIAKADGAVSKEEEEVFEQLIRLLEIPDQMVQAHRVFLTEIRQAAKIREGNLPTTITNIILEAGEIAHLETSATFRQVTASKIRDIAGRMIITNRQIHFVSISEGGWSIQFGKVLRIEERGDGVMLELGVKKGNGYYHSVPQPLILSATLDALVRIHKRLLLQPQTERASRSIPQSVKIAVWQRDQGKCTQCSATEYLEFDHVIPHSLGGANTEGNIQLLCRRCNLQKSNRI